MKAIVLTEYGDASKLVLRELPEPKAGPGELAVKVAAASLNPVDWKLRSGALKAYMPLELPAVLGRDVAGEVVALGAGVTGFKVGDRVLGMVQHGYAELVAAPAAGFALVPEGLDLRDAAAIPVVGLTGAILVEEALDVRPGQTVLVTGAVGGVGRSAVYAAKARGAEVIAGVRTKQLAEARKLGAASVVALDDDAAIAALPPLDAVADTVGGPTQAKVTARVKPGGVVACVVGPAPGDPARGVVGRAAGGRPDGKRLAGLAKAVQAGELRLPVARRFPLAEAAEAHRFAEGGGVGKVLLIA
jgi:NADPH:quinone reductase-like Zn-dependent oxidoreductase